MKRILVQSFLLLFVFGLSCKNNPANYEGQYPDDVRAILVNKCATSGCHNEKSYKNAAGLLLDTWEHLFDGAYNGAVVVPYAVDNSSLLYFINNDATKGPVAQPRMPLDMPPLTESEYNTIKNWIAAGAPDKAGNIPFGDRAATRQKIYLTQQGCDQIAVIDAEKKVVMRYIPIGMSGAIESPHCVRFSEDGKYAYVSFTAGQYVQKIDVEKDKVVNNLLLGTGSWNVFNLSQDGKKMMISDFSDAGKVVYIDVEAMSIIKPISGFLVSPHGIASNAAFDTFFVTSQYGNTVYTFNLKSYYKILSINGALPNNKKDTYDPHEIIMTPDHSKYFLTCQSSDEVRVMDAKTNKLVDSIKVGTYPQELAISKTKPYIFVSCENDVTSEYPAFKGSVYVINYNTMKVVKRISGPFYQIHGITVDDENGVIYIASRNVTQDGPAPHHTSVCGGRNGYYNLYDLNTLQPFNTKRYEVIADPYSADVRFK